MERRTVLRAGAVAWTAPAIVAATAVPAFACSPAGSLTITAFTANYQNHTNASTVNPHLIVVSSTATNAGNQATTSYTRTLTIPGGLFDSVSSSVDSDYGTPSVSGNFAGGWTITYVRSAVLGVGATDNFGVTLTVGGTAASPFRGWQGPAFALAGDVDGGTACGVVSDDDPVEATPNTTLTVNTWQANRLDDTDLWVGDTNDTGNPSTYIRNTGRKAVGPVTLDVTVPDVAGEYSAVSASDPANVSAGWEFVQRTPPSNTVGPWTYTFRTTGDYLAPDAFNAGLTNDRTPLFRARILLAGGSGTEPGTVNILAVASAPGANDSAQASNDAE